ncbi:MAG: aminotransferase class I/II-fold pyridoxal phosphate-dependent enzyme [Candidatus Krumholzibacteria bacterium]|nr:aminotransferase class I/II-fold pyridoxal phosphate-dependent enzyme [Candidatus Krumholzibacteria bacterium]
MNSTNGPVPVPGLSTLDAYDPGGTTCPTDLRLSGNEGRAPSRELLLKLTEAGVEGLRRYPDRRPLEVRLADLNGLKPENVLVTAGADDALDRICRTYLDSARNLVVATPTFEMIPRYARLAGAEVREAAWRDELFPVTQVLDLVDAQTGVIAVVTPNNPTGTVATAADLVQLSDAAPQALLLVDLAYGEFADEDLMPTVLKLPNAVGVRSMSKAWGLAGLRVGYVAGPESLIAPLRAAGGPYAVSGPSLAVAQAALADQPAVESFVAEVRCERGLIQDCLTTLGAVPTASQANFAYAEINNAGWVQDGLAGLGIAIRHFGAPDGPGHIRISCPGDEQNCARVTQSLKVVLAPEALLFDMDGVLADVSGSYRQAILETVRSYGQEVTLADIAEAKRLPGSNNDWELTRSLLAARKIRVDLAAVTERFQEFYNKLSHTEKLLPTPALLRRLAAYVPLAIVTGRPRLEAEEFLARTGSREFFTTMVCLEDGPEKPDPAPVRLALERLGVERAWMFGDTVNDILAARRAGVLPLGMVPPGESPDDYSLCLTAAGAGRVFTDLSALQEVLPI